MQTINKFLIVTMAVLALSFTMVPSFAMADGYDEYDYFGTVTPDQYDYYGTVTPDQYDYFGTVTPNASSYTPSYTTSYGVSGYPTSSYFGGSGYIGGGYVTGGGYLPSYNTPSYPTTGGGSQNQNQNQGQDQHQTQTQTSTNTNNNSNVNNNVITVNVPAPVVYVNNPIPTTPTYNYPVCTLSVSNYGNYSYGYQPVTLSWTSQYATSGFINNGVGSVSNSGSITVNPQYTTTYTGTFYGQNGQQVTCSATVTRGVVYNNNTPYIALSATPYTGLDLGFWGTVAYYDFLVLWCLVAAYLVVVKKVQNRILNSLNSFLFGSTTHQVATVSVAPAATVSYSAPVTASKVDAIDDFIMSQINRVGR